MQGRNLKRPRDDDDNDYDDDYDVNESISTQTSTDNNINDEEEDEECSNSEIEVAQFDEANKILGDNDDDDDDASSINLKLDYKNRKKQSKYFKAIIKVFEDEERRDLKNPLASRIHLERLVEEYWELKSKMQLENSIDEENNAKLQSLRRRIISHPYSNISSANLQWPLSIDDVPIPEWTLAEEVTSILRNAPTSIAASATSESYTAMMNIFYDSSQYFIKGKDKLKSHVITWREIVQSIEKRSEIPPEILQRMYKRIDKIFGNSSSSHSIPKPSLMKTLGDRKSSHSLMNPIINQYKVKEKNSILISKRKKARLRQNLDEELLLQPIHSSNSIQLASPPIK